MRSKKQTSKNRQQLIRLSKTLPNQLKNILSSKTLIKGSRKFQTDHIRNKQAGALPADRCKHKEREKQ